MAFWRLWVLWGMGVLACHGMGEPVDQEGERPSVQRTWVENNLVEVLPPMNPFLPFEPSVQAHSVHEAMKRFRVPGLAVASIQKGKVAWTQGYGVLVNGVHIPVDDQTLFEAASATKMVVAAIVMNGLERGLFDLDADVNGYLNDWKIPETSWTRERKVTLRTLLSHQAGFPETNFGVEGTKIPTLIQVLSGTPPAHNQPAVPQYQPGTRWVYSNMGYVVIQKVLEDTYKEPLADIAEDIIFKPLDMNHSTFRYPLKEEWRTHEAMPHDASGAVCSPVMVPTALAQGGMLTTVGDMARFMAELQAAASGTSQRLMTQGTFRKMTEPQRDIVLGGVSCQQCLGVFASGEGKGRVIFHLGLAFPGSAAWPFLVPGHGDGGVVLCNGANSMPLMVEVIGALTRLHRR